MGGLIMNNLKTNVGMLAVLLGLAVAGSPGARAAYVVDLDQIGSNVVATGSGSLNFSDLTFTGFDDPLSVGINPSSGYLAFGNLDGSGSGIGDNFVPVSGPALFGSGLFTAADSTTGFVAGINGGAGVVITPSSYSAGSPISGTATWDNRTLASLGVNPGAYVWTWGSANADSFTLNVSSIPELSTWAMIMLGFAGLGFAGYRASRNFASAG
jgi:hypothetical protein